MRGLCMLLLLAFRSWLCAIPGRQAVCISLALSRVHAGLVNDILSQKYLDIDSYMHSAPILVQLEHGFRLARSHLTWRQS